MDSNKIFETYNELLINDSEILYKCMNFIYLFQMTGKIYICRFRRPMVVERIIYYSSEIVIRNNEVLLRQCLTIPNENNNSRSLIIFYISLIYNFNNN